MSETRMQTLPQCPACGSFALYRERSGMVTCETCHGSFSHAVRASEKVEAKLCESCGRSFFRPTGTPDKYCAQCRRTFAAELANLAAAEAAKPRLAQLNQCDWQGRRKQEGRHNRPRRK